MIFGKTGKYRFIVMTCKYQSFKKCHPNNCIFNILPHDGGRIQTGFSFKNYFIPM